MSAETRARDLLERFESGDRSRDLLEELDAVADEVADEARRRSLVEAIYEFLYEEPHVFVGPIARTVGGLTARDDIDRAVLIASSSFTGPAESYADAASAVTLSTVRCSVNSWHTRSQDSFAIGV